MQCPRLGDTNQAYSHTSATATKKENVHTMMSMTCSNTTKQAYTGKHTFLILLKINLVRRITFHRMSHKIFFTITIFKAYL